MTSIVVKELKGKRGGQKAYRLFRIRYFIYSSRWVYPKQKLGIRDKEGDTTVKARDARDVHKYFWDKIVPEKYRKRAGKAIPIYQIGCGGMFWAILKKGAKDISSNPREGLWDNTLVYYRVFEAGTEVGKDSSYHYNIPRGQRDRRNRELTEGGAE